MYMDFMRTDRKHRWDNGGCFIDFPQEGIMSTHKKVIGFPSGPVTIVITTATDMSSWLPGR